jgi:hypothetical protein
MSRNCKQIKYIGGEETVISFNTVNLLKFQYHEHNFRMISSRRVLHGMPCTGQRSVFYHNYDGRF